MLNADVMIDDFEAGSNIDWDYLSDQVMGGISEGSASLGRDENEAYAHMTGDVSTANNGGFIQLRTSLKSGADKNTKGVFIKVRVTTRNIIFICEHEERCCLGNTTGWI